MAFAQETYAPLKEPKTTGGPQSNRVNCWQSLQQI